MKSSQTTPEPGKLVGTLADIPPIGIRLVEQEREHAMWAHLINRYHYRGFPSNRGCKLRYLLFAGEQVLGAIGWKSGSLQLESRDCFIGWSPAQRRQYLAHIINNDRFLILEQVRIKNLASHVLSRNMRMVVQDWPRCYGTRPFLLETFIDPFFSGTCYRAAGWQHVGQTKGYAKLHGGYRYHGQIKEVYVYVVEPELRRIIGCTQRRCPPRKSQKENREEKLHMMMQDVGYDPQLIAWAQLDATVIARLAAELVDFHQQFAHCFARQEQRLLSASYLHGLLSDIRHKTAESIALSFLGTKAVRCLQNFLSRYRWDDARMLQRHQELLSGAIGEQDGMLSVDSSEIAKKGEESVGVARQYCGSRGKTENCQSGVFVGYSSRSGYALVDRQLYVPEVWFSAAYSERRAKCSMPETLQFQTKIQIAAGLLQTQIRQGVLPSRWIGCDSAFGTSQWFRDTVAGWGKLYLAELRSDAVLWPAATARSARKVPTVREIAAAANTTWKPVILAEGAKGPIIAEISMQRVVEKNEQGEGDKERWLIIRRLEGGKLKYFLSNAPKDIAPEELQRALLMRWPIEQCFEDGKKYLGLDHYEHRSWNSWHRHMLYVFLAQLFLLHVRLTLKKNSNPHAAASATVADGDPGSTALG